MSQKKLKRSRQKERSKKEAATDSRWFLMACIVLAIAIALLVVAITNLHNGSGNVQLVKSSLKFRSYVPRPQLINFEFTVNDNVSFATLENLKKSLDVILQLEESSHLLHADDKKIFQLARAYKNGTREFRAHFYDVKQGATVSRAAFLCSQESFALGTSVKATRELLAVSLYHELWHAVECLERDKNAQKNHEEVYAKEPWKGEWRAYAAQVRFLFALVDKGMFPEFITKEDAWMLQSTGEAWNALYDGSFYRWYQLTIKTGRTANLPGVSIEVVK